MELGAFFKKGISYEAYTAEFAKAVEEKRTSRPLQNEELTHYTELNFRRSSRIYKHTALLPELLEAAQAIEKPVDVIVLTEFWCGDAAQNIPVIELLAEQSGKLNLRYLFRDENLELMDQYLTKGGRSIPKLIFMHADSGNEILNWGPRPAEAQRVVEELKAKEMPKAEFLEAVQRWYNADKTISLQRELVDLLVRLCEQQAV